MSVPLFVIPIVFGVMFAVLLFGETGVLPIGIGLAVGLAGSAAWSYSPPPDHNGGWGSPPARWQQWGWTSDPATEYEEPTAEDVMAPALSGLMMATPKDGDDE